MSPKLSGGARRRPLATSAVSYLLRTAGCEPAPDLQAVDQRPDESRLPPAAPRPRRAAGGRGSVRPARESPSRRAAARRSACRRWRAERRVCASAPRTAARVAASRREPARADPPDPCRERRRRAPRRRAARASSMPDPERTAAGTLRRERLQRRFARPRAASCGAAPCIPARSIRRSAVSRYVSTWLSVGPRRDRDRVGAVVRGRLLDPAQHRPEVVRVELPFDLGVASSGASIGA